MIEGRRYGLTAIEARTRYKGKESKEKLSEIMRELSVTKRARGINPAKLFACHGGITPLLARRPARRAQLNYISLILRRAKLFLIKRQVLIRAHVGT